MSDGLNFPYNTDNIAIKELLSEHLWWVCWGGFALFTYILGYLDYVYYHDNIAEKMKRIYDALTEED